MVLLILILVNQSVTQDTSGNAATATALETARNIGGVSFDGIANINLPGVNTAGNQDTSGNAATATALETARNIGGVSFDGTANINLPGVNQVTQDTSGNAATATTADGTVTTAAQPNITSVGTLTSLTVDDVAIDGKVITMHNQILHLLDTDDTAVFTAGTNGELTITTTDTAGAAANITITADGTAELAGTTVTLNSSGGVTLDADNGTITFSDAGVSLGTITSSGYSGNAATATALETARNIGGVSFDGIANINLPGVNTAGNQDTSGNAATATSATTAGTVTTAAQPNITSVGTLTALTVDDVAINGKVITMTGDTDDTAVFTAGTNGELTITTTDTAGAAANITITADGTTELAGTTVTLNSSGGVTIDADGGTITFSDNGVSLGTITSSGYSGNAATATTAATANALATTYTECN